jgi:hypothetical protein
VGVKERRCRWGVESRAATVYVWMLSPREQDKEKLLSCYVAAWYASWGASSDKAVAAADPCPASCRSCSFLLPPVFILRTRSSHSSLSSLSPLSTPHPLLHINRLQTVLRHLYSTSCHPQSHRTCLGFPVSVHHHPLYTVTTAVSPWPGASAQPPRFADRPTHPAVCFRPRYPSCGLPVLSSAICVFPFALVTLTPTRTLPRFSMTATFSPKALSPVA